mgnify:CR=1 FL=1
MVFPIPECMDGCASCDLNSDILICKEIAPACPPYFAELDVNFNEERTLVCLRMYQFKIDSILNVINIGKIGKVPLFIERHIRIKESSG